MAPRRNSISTATGLSDKSYLMVVTAVCEQESTKSAEQIVAMGRSIPAIRDLAGDIRVLARHELDRRPVSARAATIPRTTTLRAGARPRPCTR